MPSVLIFGGSGKIAKFITESLVQKGYQVSSVIRREEHIPSLRELGATPILQSIESASVSELVSTIRTSAPDIVIFAAGAGLRAFEDPNLSLVVDRDAAIRVFDAMVEAGGAKRLITISTMDARNREKAAPSWYNEVDRKGSDELWGMLPVYMKGKYEADKRDASQPFSFGPRGCIGRHLSYMELRLILGSLRKFSLIWRGMSLIDYSMAF